MLLPATAQACAVCGQGAGLNRTAFLITTVVLSLLPLALIGGGLLWLKRNARAFLDSEFRESDETPAGEAPAATRP